jgi:hypothetical protein
MKGVVFTEFLDMVRSAHGEDLLDAVLDVAAPTNGGAYTAVGTYDHREMASLVTAYASLTYTSVADALRAFGQHLIGRFYARYPHFFDVPDLFSFLETIDDVIHVEVLKLYADAELPSVKVLERDGGAITVLYASTRHMEDLAHGLLEGAAGHFGERVTITRQSPDLDGVRFRIAHEAGP